MAGGFAVALVGVVGAGALAALILDAVLDLSELSRVGAPWALGVCAVAFLVGAFEVLAGAKMAITKFTTKNRQSGLCLRGWICFRACLEMAFSLFIRTVKRRERRAPPAVEPMQVIRSFIIHDRVEFPQS